MNEMNNAIKAAEAMRDAGMTDDITSRARQLLVDIGLKEPEWNPPPGHAEYETLVASVADHLRQVRADALREAAAIFAGRDEIDDDRADEILALLEPPK